MTGCHNSKCLILYQQNLVTLIIQISRQDTWSEPSLWFSSNTKSSDNFNLTIDFILSFEVSFSPNGRRKRGRGARKMQEKRNTVFIAWKMPEGNKLNSALTCKGRF